MNIQYNLFGNCRKLSHGAINELSKCDISENKKIFFVNYILQIAKCHPLISVNYYNCTLFDDEYICNEFILGYNKTEGIPYAGDIISITKIIINTLPDGEHRLFFCEEVKLLEKNAKFLINPNNLKIISSKSKNIILYNNQEIINKNESVKEKNIEQNNDIFYSEKKNENINNNINTIKKFNENNNINSIEEKKEEKYIIKNSNKSIKNINTMNNNFIIYNENENINIKDNDNKEFNEVNYSNIYKDMKKENNNEKKENIKENDNIKEIKEINNIKINGINNLVNKTIFTNNNNNSNKINSTIIKNSNTKLIKIEPLKKEEGLESKEKEILESINIFIDDFKEGKNLYKEDNNNNNLPITLEESEEIEIDKKYEIINPTNNLNINKKDMNAKEEENSKNIINSFKLSFNNEYYNIIFIKEIKQKNLKHKKTNFKIKCRIKYFKHSYQNFYGGCSNCYKKINNKIDCCKNGKEILIYNFNIIVIDPSGELQIYFFDKIGREFMGIDAEKYKKFLDAKEAIEKIILSEYINDFYNNEFLFDIELNGNKDINYKYNVVKVERITKKHIYKLVKQLNNVLQINQ